MSSRDGAVTSGRTTIRGCEIAYDRSGTGLDLVWGHGLTQSRRLEDRDGLLDWSRVRARVLQYDARGHGESDSTGDLDGYAWHALASDQLALASAVGIDRYVAGGASMGAATALHAALAAPDRVVALIVVIPPTAWESRSEQAAIYERSARMIEERGVEPVIRAGEAVPPPDPFVADRDRRRRRAEALRSWEPTRLARVMRGAAPSQLPPRERIAMIACPTLLLAWTGDPAHPVSTAAELARLIPHAEVSVDSERDGVERWSERIAEFVCRLGDPTRDHAGGAPDDGTRTRR